MLTNEHHPTINRQQLYDMAVLGHDSLYKLVASWTGGTYDQVDTDYHINIGPKGQVYLTCRLNTVRSVPSGRWQLLTVTAFLARTLTLDLI